MHSGGFDNPVLTVGMACTGRLSPKKVPAYLAMQFAGALLGATAAYAYYSPAIDAFEGGPGIRTVPGSAKFFATIYAPGALPFDYQTLPLVPHMVAQVVLVMAQSTFIPVDPFQIPVFLPICLSVLNVIGRMAVNPARDLATCLVLHGAGYGGQVWTQGSMFYWPITVISTVFAAIFGANLGIGLELERLEKDLRMRRGAL
ncbi:hypothetical protein BOTBODRAFT_29949 [Botryobasidium botryosum FD-172 SS1]|uniref:Aquaporin-like protein n=1 Tax=Botryobasidium botryosum (strain FD-172 SS1) TaxID=930990 RepID=A0A067MQF3_BOTB1|nr:hypothetical protein BOTBODRAFT_29949 [Botryobasidium botryosum FD-172 SS1]